MCGVWSFCDESALVMILLLGSSLRLWRVFVTANGRGIDMWQTLPHCGIHWDPSTHPSLSWNPFQSTKLLHASICSMALLKPSGCTVRQPISLHPGIHQSGTVQRKYHWIKPILTSKQPLDPPEICSSGLC